MLQIIPLVLLLQLFLMSVCYSQNIPYPQHSALRPASPKDSWIVESAEMIGYKSRVNAIKGQDPFPFCFSAAAAILWDQHRCQNDNLDCAAQERTSFLAVTSAGQQLSNNELKHNDGGSSLISLSRIVEQGGAVVYGQCNYDYIANPRNPQQYLIMNMFNITKEWKKYKDYTPYMERYHRRNFLKLVYSFNPYLTVEQSTKLLDDPGTKIEQFFAKLVVNDMCFETNFTPDNRFEIHRIKMGNVFNTKLTFDTIDKLLKRNIPVMITFCVNPEAKIEACVKHAAVVVSKSRAINQITGDTRSVYWIVNTWGEGWQAANEDGWMFAENFINSAFGEIIWLEPKKKSSKN